LLKTRLGCFVTVSFSCTIVFLSINKTIGNDIFVDVLITLTLMVCFYGTFSGMAAAMVGGLTASVVLFVMKKTMVHEKLTFVKQPRKFYKLDFSTPKPTWVKVQPDWRK